MATAARRAAMQREQTEIVCSAIVGFVSGPVSVESLHAA